MSLRNWHISHDKCSKITVLVCRFLVHTGGEPVATDGNVNVWKSNRAFRNYLSLL